MVRLASLMVLSIVHRLSSTTAKSSMIAAAPSFIRTSAVRQAKCRGGSSASKFYFYPDFLKGATIICSGTRSYSRAASRLNLSGSSNRLSEPVYITSKKSNTVKKWQALLQKRKKRTEFNATVIEGPRMVLDLLNNPKTTRLVENVMIAESKANDFEPQRLQQIHPHIQVCVATDEIVAACSDTVTPQGIVATIAIPAPPSEAAPRSVQNNRTPLYLVLDGVSDPGNVGTLLRSSVAVGVSVVLLLPHCCDVWNPKAVRSAMGCSFQVPILSVDSFEEGQKVLEAWGVKNIYAATMIEKDESKNDEKSSTDPSTEHYLIDWTESPTALVIGSEGTGLSKVVRDAVFSNRIRAVHVPMEAGIESLNAAVCGSVILFEYLRQCRTLELRKS